MSSSFSLHVNKVWRAGIHLLQETARESCKINCEISVQPACSDFTVSQATETSGLLFTCVCVCELNFFFLGH